MNPIVAYEGRSCARNPDGSIINRSGSKVWVNDDGQLHREDGPAVVSYRNNMAPPTLMAWWRYDKLHRETGPAVVRVDNGIVTFDYALEGEHVTRDEFEERTGRKALPRWRHCQISRRDVDIS